MAKFDNCFIFMPHNSFSENPYFFYKYPIKGIIACEHSYCCDDYFVARGSTPENIREYLKSNTNDNLIVLEMLLGEYSDIDTVDKVSAFFDDIIAIILNNPSIEILSLNFDGLYNPYAERNSTDFIDLFIDKMSPNALKNILGEKAYNNIRGIKYEIGVNTILKVLKDGYRTDDFINLFSGYNKEFLQISSKFLYYSYRIDSTILYNLYKNIANMKYYSSYDSTQTYSRLNASPGYDYYKSKGTKNYSTPTRDDKARKKVIYDKLDADSNYIPFKYCGFEKYLYYRYRGNLINGYPFTKFKYPRPDDIWYGELPVGDYKDVFKGDE